MKKVVLKTLTCILASAMLILTSCEIGLGSAVDTEVPTITLTQPEADSIVYDKFVMTGAWTDDLSLKAVTIQFKDVNDNTKIYGEYEAQLTGTDTAGEWTCEIDPIAINLPDGPYVATATAYDNAEHSAIATTTFSVDNTPPLIVLENPTTTSIDKPNSYGQSFTVTGKAADDSDVDSIDFIFYDVNGVELHRTNIKGVGTQLEVTVAQWGDDVYNKIYGTNKEAGTKAYYVGLVAYDGARKVPAVEGDKGNASTSFYLWDQLESEIGTIKTSIGYKVMNGRSVVSDDDKTKWKAALEKLKIEKATFSLNPVNNPYFEVSRFEGFEDGKGNLDGNEFTNKNTLVLNIYRGRDNKAIIEDTIGVYLRECDKTGKLVEGAAPIVLLQPYCDKNKKVYTDESGKPLIDQTVHSNAISSLDSSYTTTFSVNNEVYTGLVFNKYYLIDVVAYDLNGSDIRTDLKYGFKMVTTATPPVVTVTTPANGGNIPNSKTFKVEGYAKTQEDAVSIKVYNEAATGTPFASSDAKTVTIGAYDKTNLCFPFSFTVDTTAKTIKGDELPKIVIEATSSSGLVTTQEVKIDPEFPKIGDCSIAPTVDVTAADGKTTAYVNGTITVKQSLTDNQMIKKAEYSLDDGATWTSQGATNMLSFEVDTTKYTDKAAKILKVKVEDTAGNVSSGTITLNVDQSTDAPKVTLTNANMTVTDVSQISTTTNLFGTVTNNQLLGSVSDDDGIDKIFITVTNKDTGAVYTFAEGTESAEYAAGKTIGGKTTYNIAYSLPSVEGLYEIKVKVVDSKQDTTGYNFVETASFLTAVDNGAPNLTITTTNRAYQAPNATFTLSGTSNDTGATIGIFTDLACTTPLKEGSAAITISPEGLWSYVITTGENGASFYVRAIDKYGQSSVELFEYMIDAQSPKFTVTQVGVGDDSDIRDNKDEDETNDEHDNDNLSQITKFASANSLYTVRGKVRDFGPSGLGDNLYYIVSSTEPAKAGAGDSEYYVINTINGWKPAIISKNADSEKLSTWVANIDLSEKNDDGSRKFAEGNTYNLYLAVKDNANNTSLISANKASSAIRFTLDSNNPYIESMGLEDEGASSYVFVKAKDVESGINKVTLVLNSQEQNVTTSDVTDAEDPTGKDPKDVLRKYRFLVDLSSISNSSDIKYTIIVKDNAGNSDSKPVQPIDNTSPSIDFADWYSSLYRKGDYYYTKENINIGYTVNATTNGISSIKYNENSTGDISQYLKTAGEATFPTKFPESGTITITIIKPTSSKKVDNVFTATNKYNNSSSQTLKYIFDVDKPKISLNDDTTVKTGQDNFFNATKVLLIEGTAADTSNPTAELNSGISEIKYSLVTGDSDTPGTWDDVQGTLNWKLKLDLTADTYAEGRYTLFFKSIDNVGNESDVTKVKLIADKNEPEFKITKINGTPASALASYYPDDVVIEGTLEDTYLSEYTVTVNGTGSNFDTGNRPTLYSDTPLASQDWKLTLSKSVTEYTVVITAKDKVGNAIPVTTLKTSIDTAEPTFTITEVNGEKTPSKLPSAAPGTYSTYGNLSSFFKISGEVTDTGNSGLDSYMYYKLIEGTTAPDDASGTFDISTWETVSIDPQIVGGTTKYMWSINANFGTVTGLDNGEDCYVLIAAKDNAGKISKINDNPSNKIKVRIDGNAPVVDNQPSITYDSVNNKNIISFKVHDADSGVASFKLKNKRTNVAKTFTPPAIAKGTTATEVTCEITPGDLTAIENVFTIEVTDCAGNTETTDSVTVSKSAAEITFSAPDAQYVNGGYNYYNNGFTITGSYSVPAGNALKSLTVNDASPTTIDETAKTFTYAVTAADTAKSTITIKTTTSFGETQTKTYNYVVDTTAPTFTITKIDGKTAGMPAANAAAGSYSTYGKLANYFVIEGSSSDTQTGKQDSGVGNYLYYKMVKGATAPETDAANTAIYKDVTSWNKTNITKSNGNWSADLNFNNVTGLTNGDDCYIYFATVDNVGNVSTIAGSPSNKIKVRIDGVAPVFAATPTVTLGGAGTEDKAVVSVKAKDEHSSLADADVKLVLEGTALSITPSVSTADAQGYKTYSFTLTSANLNNGLNNFTIQATDAAGNTGTSSAVTIDNSAPNIVTSHSLSYVDAEGYYYSNTNFDINSVITVTADQNKLASVTGATPVSGDNYKHTISGAASTGKSTYTVTATSIFGKSTTKTVKYVIDATAPTFVLSNYTGYTGTPADGTSALAANVTTFGNTESYFTVEGKIADAAASGKVASGYVTNVYYNVAKTEPAKASGVYDITASGWKSTPLQAGGSFSLPLKFSDFSAAENDTFTIYLAAKDNAGNISAPATYKLSVKIDGTKPTVGTPVLTLGTSYADTSFTTIVVPASDGGSGIDENSAVITLNDEAYTKATKTFANGEYTFKIKNTDAGLAEGKNVFVVTVTDKAGNYKASSQIIINNDAPVITSTASNASNYKSGDAVYSNEQFTIAGNVTVSRNNLISATSWNDGTKNAQNKVIENLVTLGGSGAYTITINPKAAGETRTSVITNTITATNVFGIPATKSLKYIFDTTAPTFTLSAIKGTAASVDKDSAVVEKYGNVTDPFKVKGSVTETGSGIGSYIYYKVATTAPADANTDGIYDGVDEWSTSAIKSGSFEIPVSFEGLTEGTAYYIYLATIDNVGNVSAIADNPSNKIKVTIDSKAPIYKAPSLSYDDEKSQTILKFPVKDEVSGIASNTIYLNGETYSKVVSGYPTTTAGTGAEDGYTIYEYRFANGDSDLAEGANKFKVTFTDKNNNSSTTAEITVNNDAPVLSGVKIGNAASKNRDSADDNYVLENSDFTVTGSVSISASNKLANVTWADTSTGTITAVTCGDSDKITATGSFTISIPVTGAAYASYENQYVTRTLTATNIYDKSSTAEVYFRRDTTAPEIVLTDVTGESKTAKGLTIGGKLTTQLGDWLNSTNLSIAGSYKDNGSGVEKVTYYWTSEGDGGNIFTSGSTVISNNTYYPFSGTVGGFEEKDNNVIHFTVTDRAGNTVSAVTECTVKVDITNPKISGLNYGLVADLSDAKSADSAILTNRSADIVLSGSFSDQVDGKTVSGVDSAYKIDIKIDGASIVKTNGVTVAHTVANNYSSGTWTAVIDKSKLSSKDGTYQAVVDITDNAGNVDKSTSCSIKVDNKAPTTKVESPSTTATLNGKNTFSGKVTENNNPKSIELRYVFSAIELAATDLNALSKWPSTQVIGKKTVGDTGVDIGAVSSWKFENIDVNAYLLTGKSSGYLYILPIAYDEAGNCSIGSTIAERTSETEGWSKFSVDLDSDRPTIKFTNLGKGQTYLKNTSTLTGSVTDDDGVAVLKISNSTNEPDWSTITGETDPSTINFALGADGLKTLWFYIEDTAGGVFKTNSTRLTSSLATPKLIFNSKTGDVTDTDDNTAEISFTTDSNAPSITATKFGYGTDSAKSAEATPADFAATGNKIGGPNRKFVSFAISVDDSSGIQSVKVNLDSTDYELAESETAGTYIYKTGTPAAAAGIDVSGVTTSGTKTVTFTVTDNAGLETQVSKSLIIDNDKPTAELISPTDEVYGVVTLKGTASDEFTSIADVKYYIPTDANYTGAGDTLVDLTTTDFSTISNVLSGTTSSWTFKLDGATVTVGENEISNSILPVTETALESYSKVPYDSNNIYTLPVFIYVEDEVGNADVIKSSIKYNPFGNRPVTTIAYPTSAYAAADTAAADKPNYITGYENVNGSIRISGAATCNTTLNGGKVYIQIDANKDGKFDAADVTALADAGYTIVSDITTGSTDENKAAITYVSESTWGILVSGTNNWNFTLNSNAELKLDSAKVSDGKYKIGVRAITKSAAGMFGSWSDSKYFMIDINAPQISSASLVADTTTTVAQTYVEDMYLKGTQYLKLSITDKTGLSKITYSYAKDISTLASAPKATVPVNLKTLTNGGTADDGTIASWTAATSTEPAKYTVYIPVSTLPAKIATGNKAVSLKVTAYKDSESESTDYQRYSMSFDNTAPAITYIKFNGDEGDTTEGSMSNRIVNSNGTYFTLGGKVKDEDSGFDKLAFYYYRDKQDNVGQKRRVYDPMKAPEGTTYKSAVQVTADASTDLVSGITKVDITGTTKTVPLYGYTKTVTVQEKGSQIVLGTALAATDNIRVGGLVQINSIWHTISAIAADNKTITLSTATTSTGSVSAFFPIAQVIDNTGSEKTEANGDFISGESGDDGDGMAESIIKSGTFWTLDATIHSNYIPDGPGTLVAVLWDKAGNVEVQEYTASVQNNAPRLTKLWLGTSLSSNFEESNFTEYDVLAKAGEQRSYTMETANFNSKKRFRVKGDLAVVTEFVGGNNAHDSGANRIKMVYNNDASAETAGYVVANAAKSNVYTRDAVLSAKEWFAHSSGYESGELENFAFKISKDDLGTDSTYAAATGYSKRSMSFTFWDDTDETTQCKNSCYSYLKISDLIVMVDDNFAPTVAIDPFYWKSPEDNSLVGYSYKNGHIDLPTVTGATLDTETGLFKHATSGLVAGSASNKPQVSGSVSVRGTALDEHTLNSIWVAFTNNAATPASVITPDADSYLATETGSVYYKVAQKAADGSWTTASGTTWKFYIENDESTQEGQIITWRLDVDTSKMTGSMGTNKVFRVMARDDAYGKTGKANADHESSGTSVSGTLGRNGRYDLLVEGTNQPAYTVDVVPYISDVYTDTTTAANRSRLGRYSVQADSTIYLKGFNFGAGTVTATRHKTSSGAAASGSSGTITATRTDANTITVIAPAYSGFVNVSITPDGGSAVVVPNNSNTNTAYNIQEGYVASEANTYGATAASAAGKNFWTDDVYLSVWNNTARTGSVNPWDGTVRKLKTSESKSGKFYANKSGSAVDEMTNSLDTWFGAWSSPNMMIYDEAGNGDFANKRTLYNNSQASFVNPVETMDIAIIGGIPWYVFNDNYVGGSSANSWGAGLILAREGYDFPKGDFNSTSSPTESEFVNIIERQGSGTAADSRNSSGGYDSVLHQFKNPRITGWYDGTAVTMNNGNGDVNYDGTNYIYVSYYDSFSHCLKYAAFSEAWSKDGVGSKWGNVNGTKNFKDLARSANSMVAPTTVVSGVDRMYTAYDFGTAAGEEAGEWSDIMVDPTDHFPVIIYYNKTKGSLEVAHGKNNAPETANYKTAAGSFTDTTEGTNGWTKKKSITPIAGHDFGRYVSAEMDRNGNIHATAQDFTTGALWYVFLKKTETSYTATYQIIDAEISAGIWADIQLDNDLAANTTWAQYKPVISYIDQSKKLPKIAYVETIGSGQTAVSYFEAVSDANNYEAKEMKTSCMTSVYEAKIKNDGAQNNNSKSKAGVAFNSDMLCIDFLRDEQ